VGRPFLGGGCHATGTDARFDTAAVACTAACVAVQSFLACVCADHIHQLFRVAVWDDPGFITGLFDWALVVDAVLLVLLVIAILESRRASAPVA
jgi:hypothetical protein